MALGYTDTCMVCGRKFTEDDGSIEFALKVQAKDPSLVICCCDNELSVKDGRAVAHHQGKCDHCCPEHGAVADPFHDTELCGICTNDGESD